MWTLQALRSTHSPTAPEQVLPEDGPLTYISVVPCNHYCRAPVLVHGHRHVRIAGDRRGVYRVVGPLIGIFQIPQKSAGAIGPSAVAADAFQGVALTAGSGGEPTPQRVPASVAGQLGVRGQAGDGLGGHPPLQVADRLLRTFRSDARHAP